MSHDFHEYDYYEYDGIYYRLAKAPQTGRVYKAEGYFKGQGYIICEAYSILRYGEMLNESEFKRGIAELARPDR